MYPSAKLMCGKEGCIKRQHSERIQVRHTGSFCVLSVLEVDLAGVTFSVSCLLVTFSSHRASAPNCFAVGQCLPHGKFLTAFSSFLPFFMTSISPVSFKLYYLQIELHYQTAVLPVIFIYMQCGPLSVCDHSLKMRLKELAEYFPFLHQ